MAHQRRSRESHRPIAHMALDADMISSDGEGSVILVHIRPSDGPDDMVGVVARSEKEAIKLVKEWLISIDYNEAFPGIKFKAHPLDVDSLTILKPR